MINIGVAAHVTAASPGGARYDATLSHEQRTSIENGIWLCQGCGTLVDRDELAFSVAVLRGWKEQAERTALQDIAGQLPRRIAILERRLAGHENFVWDVAVTPDGRKIVSASNDGSIRIWDAATGCAVAVLSGHDAFVCSISISRDGYFIATGAADGRVIIWTITGNRQAEFFHGALDAKVSWLANNEAIVTGGADGCLAFWESDLYSLLGRSRVHAGPILKVICMRDCKRVASVSEDKTVRVFDIDNAECTQVFAGHAAAVNSVVITPDDKCLVSASSDKTVRIWELQSAECKRILYGHGDVVWRVAVSPNGKLLASGSGDNTVCLWLLDTGELLQTLKHPDCIAAVAFSPDGHRLVVGCDDSQIYLYRLSDM